MTSSWTLNTVDLAAVAAYLALSLGIGLYYSRRASKDVGEYFLSGRSLPWWLLGTSMVATTFSADTPLAVAGLVGHHGVAGNWVWWNFALGNVLTVIFFAHLWRRAGISTDVELCEVRYSGRPAGILRGFRAIWLGIVVNAAIIGWVNLAMAKILMLLLGWDKQTVVLICFGITGLYACFSGLWGVVVTDAFQFVLAMGGSVLLAFLALKLPGVDGLQGLHRSLPPQAFDLLPHFSPSDASMGPATMMGLTALTFLAHIGVQWWSSWYPGAEPGGGGYIAQRMMSAKDERHAVLATLWFTIAHYCLRPWPWIIVGLVALRLHPNLLDKESGYVLVMQQALPPGLRGLLLSAFLAAYMSTVSTQLNWGASYIVNDFYKRFLVPQASPSHYVWISRGATLLVLIAGAGVTFFLQSVAGTWQLVLETGAGLGFVLILRWYWWRISAWSEITATIAPVVGFALSRWFFPLPFPNSLFVLTLWTVAFTLLVTFLTPAESQETLIGFYKRVRPTGPGWKRVATAAGLREPAGIGSGLLCWALGSTLVYATLMIAGSLLLGQPRGAIIPALVAIPACWGLKVLLKSGNLFTT